MKTVSRDKGYVASAREFRPRNSHMVSVRMCNIEREVVHKWTEPEIRVMQQYAAREALNHKLNHAYIIYCPDFFRTGGGFGIFNDGGTFSFW